MSYTEGNGFMGNTIIVVRAAPTATDIFSFILVFLIYGIIVQLLLAVWKKAHKSSYEIFILGSALITMPFISLLLGSFFSFCVYLCFLSFMSYLAFTALSFKSDKNAPRFIFKAFKGIFIVMNAAVISSQALLVIIFYLKPDYTFLSLKLLCMFIYYAVVSREIVRNLCKIMALTTGFYSKEGVPHKKDPSNLCMICTRPLDHKDASNPYEKVLTLRCSHSYHEDCIKGWCLIGHNASCYYCKEGIDNNSFTQDYWTRTELFIRPMMNTMRSMISFSAVIFGLYYIFKYKRYSS